MGRQRHAPAALPPWKCRYSLYGRLCGLRGRCGRVRKISPLPRLDPRTIEPVANLYTDWAIPAHLLIRIWTFSNVSVYKELYTAFQKTKAVWFWIVAWDVLYGVKMVKFKCIGQFEEFRFMLVMFRDALCLLHGTKWIFKHDSGLLDMVTKLKNAYKCIEVSYTINIVCLLHVSAHLVAISRETHYQEITNFCEPTHRCETLSFKDIWFIRHT